MLLLILCLLPTACFAHVSLTFPQGRYPPLDFLDTARTSAPCGVPRPLTPLYTDLYVGEKYNITWRLQNIHQGGFRITLIDEKGNPVEQLAPMDGNGYVGADDQTAQSETVRVTKPCHHCTILLERQALEWGNTYLFHSCADVNVLEQQPNEHQKCSMNGKQENGKCICKRLYSGDICQYLAFESKPDVSECFNYDYPVDETKFNNYGLFNEKCFRRIALNDNDNVYSRVVGDEVEIILDYKGTTWVGLGWRPLNIDRSCRLFPDLENVRRKRSPTEAALSDDDEPLQPVPMPKMPKDNGFLTSALQAPLHPMDCTDIVTGAVVEGRSRINDMYTRDRSTPLVDTLLDGEESFSAAYGIEQDGRTIIMFRRRIAEIEPSDHPLGPGKLFVIYAKGQTSDGINNVPHLAADAGNFSNHDFYRSDQLRYHGAQNRGVFPIEFVTFDERPPTTRPPLRHKLKEHLQTKPQPEPQSSNEPQPEPTAEPKPQSKAELQPGSQLEPKPAAEPQPQPTSVSKSSEDQENLRHIIRTETKTQLEPFAEPEPSQSLEPVTEPKPTDTSQPKPEPKSEPGPKPNPEPQPEPVSTNELEIKSEQAKKTRYDPSAYLTSSALRLVAVSLVTFMPLIYVL
ncbi:unnamed protein product [Toxocara canis]|uniref:DOMON domain-containing protein n=1 Tax=Toxocara canis TaxID=6265 RepID=A0A183UEQ4_TOXCA|nr:unnamed protein product [Toxocara canis]